MDIQSNCKLYLHNSLAKLKFFDNENVDRNYMEKGFFMLFFLMVVISPINFEPIFAHTMDVVDDYKIEIAWMKQPRSNTENGIEVFISIATDEDKTLAKSMGKMSKMNMKKINTIEFSEGISGLDLRAELVRKKETLSFDLISDPNIPGRYFSKVTPWIHGNYQANIIGIIDDTNLSIGFHPAKVKPMTPINQLRNGVPITQVICDEDLVLIKKPSTPSVVCVREKTSQTLTQRGWELISQLEKQDLRDELLKQMEIHNQNLANLTPFFTDDTNLNEMMTEKMVEHNQLMNQLLNQKTIGVELSESIRKHVEEHQQLAEQIASISQNG